MYVHNNPTACVPFYGLVCLSSAWGHWVSPHTIIGVGPPGQCDTTKDSQVMEFCRPTETPTIVRQLVRFLSSRNVRFVFHEQVREFVD